VPQICVHQDDPLPALSQRGRQVKGHRGLSLSGHGTGNQNDPSGPPGGLGAEQANLKGPNGHGQGVSQMGIQNRNSAARRLSPALDLNGRNGAHAGHAGAPLQIIRRPDRLSANGHQQRQGQTEEQTGCHTLSSGAGPPEGIHRHCGHLGLLNHGKLGSANDKGSHLRIILNHCI